MYSLPLQASGQCFSQLENSYTHSEVLSRLENLSPGIDKDKIRLKVSSVDSSFMFYRSFVSLFYDELKARLANSPLRKLEHFQGFSPIDYHPDNFSFYGVGNKELRYQMNDYDNGNRVPVITDLIRYMSSLKIANRNRFDRKELKELIESYYKGLQGKEIDYPEFMLKNIHFKDGHYFSDSSDYGGQKLVRKLSKGRVARELSKDENHFIEQIVEDFFKGRLEVLDAFKYYNVTGGSGGLLRYKILLRDKDHILVYEFKEIEAGAFNPLNAVLNVSPIETLNFLVEDPRFRNFYGMAQMSDKTYFVRPKFDNFKQDDFLEYSNKQQLKLAKVQMNVIGLNHRIALGKKSEIYWSELSTLKDILSDKVDEMTDIMNFYYELLSKDKASL
ncbi:PF10009 domain protein [Bacteriovorax sp. BSW11_IV]|nr:PF10009 domain protein [Bacteriovorax sp. BSW11_IV]